MTETAPALGPSHSAFRSLRAWITLLIMLAAGFTADLTSKHWAFRAVHLDREIVLANENWMPPPQDRYAALPWNLLDIHLVVNRGAVFGIGANQRTFFVVFTLGALTVGLCMFGRLMARHHSLGHVAIALVLAGGIGNLYDRIVYGVVRDFLHMLPNRRLPFDWRWPGGSPEMFPWVFNVADMLLLIGMALLMLHMHRRDRAAVAEPADEISVRSLPPNCTVGVDHVAD